MGEIPLLDFGSLLHLFSETVLGHSFHANPLVNENLLFYQNLLPIHQTVYDIPIKLSKVGIDNYIKLSKSSNFCNVL